VILGHTKALQGCPVARPQNREHRLVIPRNFQQRVSVSMYGGFSTPLRAIQEREALQAGVALSTLSGLILHLLEPFRRLLVPSAGAEELPLCLCNSNTRVI